MIWLWILAILILLGILVCRTRIGIHITFGLADQATADLTIGPFTIRLAPTPPQEKKKGPKKADKPPKEHDANPAAKLKKMPRPTWAEIQDAYHTLMPPCKRALQRTRRSIRVTPFRLSVTLAGREDPAAAAERYGQAQALVWTAMPALEQLVRIPDPWVHVGIDFDAEKTAAEGDFGISIRIGTVIAVGFGIGIPALRWLYRFFRAHRKKPPARNEQTKPAAPTAA